MANIAALRTAIDSDPVNDPPATDEDVLAWFNALTEWADVPWLEFVIWLDGVDGLDRFEQIIAAPAPANLQEPGANESNQAEKSAARLGLAIVNAGQPLAASRSEVRSSLVKLVENDRVPFFTTDERDGLLALAQNQLPRWTSFAGVESPRIGHIAAARALS